MVAVIADCLFVDHRETGTGVARPFFENVRDYQFTSFANKFSFLNFDREFFFQFSSHGLFTQAEA
jgi:hypothetical protein